MPQETTAIVAHHLAGVADSALPQDVAEKTRLHLLDSLAAMISGQALKAGLRARAYVSSYAGAGRASLPGTALWLPPVEAAFAGAMAAHADETDDSHLAGRFHPGCAVVPAALAVAEHRGLSGAALLRGIAAGYDVGARATLALGYSGPRTGTHSTHCLGANFGAAAAAAALAGLDARQCEHALSYATQQASGIAYWQRDHEHVEKAFDFGGMGARNGVFATLFVASGASGCDGALEGEHSYLSAFAERADAGALTDGLGQQFEIMRGSIKKCCVGSPIQAALEAVTALIADHGVGADDVAALRAIMPDDRLPIVDGRDMPDICLQHLLAIALIDGGVTFASCHDHARMHDPKVLELRARMTAVPSRELTHAVPARQAIVEIDCTDGRRLRHHARAVQGTPENPMSAAEVEAKARDLVGPILGSARAEQFLTALRDVGQATDLRALVAAMRPAE